MLAQAAQEVAAQGGVSIGWVLTAIAAVVGTLSTVVTYLYREGRKAQQEYVDYLRGEVAAKEERIAALRSERARLTQELIALHATNGPALAEAVKALRATGKLIEGLEIDGDE